MNVIQPNTTVQVQRSRFNGSGSLKPYIYSEPDPSTAVLLLDCKGVTIGNYIKNDRNIFEYFKPKKYTTGGITYTIQIVVK